VQVEPAPRQNGPLQAALAGNGNCGRAARKNGYLHSRPPTLKP
jgi:hypothetical protein